MESVKDRFLRYVKIDTQSEQHASKIPSTDKQLDLCSLLQSELTALGAADVKLDAHGYVTATIPANTDRKAPVIGLLSHVDTADAVSGANVTPVLTPNYGGGDIDMGNGYTLSPMDSPALLDHIGEEIICTDGTTLLGADDKAGVAEIMTLAERLLSPGAPAHGTIRIGFTPDEEVGRGVDRFDVAAFKANFGYTVDGGQLGEINYECFNAASAEVRIHGLSTHTGDAKGRMINASLLAMELHELLPRFENPACTEEYEGFFHLERLDARVDNAYMHYLLRDHDMEKFEQKKSLMQKACAFLNEKYGAGTVSLELNDTYYNMKSKVPPFVVDAAKAAMEAVGVTPFLAPIRGGTDGSRLSYMGLPCPNLCTCGYNFHGRYEFIAVQTMEKVVDILTALVTSFVK
ncbi:MAG: peptidase T [Clostridiales bacterium]|nr:peptidase T [Clostridiales bacterium]